MRLKCPYCQIGINIEGEKRLYASTDIARPGAGTEIEHGICPMCERLIVVLRQGEIRFSESENELYKVEEEKIIFPTKIERLSDTSIPARYRDQFNESNSLITISAKASAAMSRRLLQEILRAEYKVRSSDLQEEINEFCKRPNIPPYLLKAVDQVRIIGNFAAHPNKSYHSGEIVEVEEGEAEWLLDILEDLLDITFMQPKKDENRQKKWDEKLGKKK